VKHKLEQILMMLINQMNSSLGKHLFSINEHRLSDSFRIECIVNGNSFIIHLSLHHLDLPWEIKVLKSNHKSIQGFSDPIHVFHNINNEPLYLTPAILNDDDKLKQIITKVVELIQ